MLLQKLAQASNKQSQSPSSGSSGSSGSKRAALEIFSQLRQVEDFGEQYRATEEEIDDMLDKDLFLEIADNPSQSIFKQFQIASDVSMNTDSAALAHSAMS